MYAKLNINDNKANIVFYDGVLDDWWREAISIIEEWKSNNINIAYINAENIIPSSPNVAQIYSLILELKKHNIESNINNLPKDLNDILSLAFNSANIPPQRKEINFSFLENVGEKFYSYGKSTKEALDFIKESFLSVIRFINGNAIFRSDDFWFIFADCSYKAIGIISLVSFLVGLILAFVGALQLQTFGAGIYVSSMVALGMTRIMAAIMVGIIMAGRTGSSYAATIGTMQVNEEIDALKTLGIKVTDYLIAPRVISLVLTIPILTLLADVLGILGGAVVGIFFLDLSSTTYINYSINALSLGNILIGLLHSLIYGVIISLCGCYQGLYAGRNADSVGKATTGAVVSALVFMIVATGILTVILEVVQL